MAGSGPGGDVFGSEAWGLCSNPWWQEPLPIMSEMAGGQGGLSPPLNQSWKVQGLTDSVYSRDVDWQPAGYK